MVQPNLPLTGQFSKGPLNAVPVIRLYYNSQVSYKVPLTYVPVIYQTLKGLSFSRLALYKGPCLLRVSVVYHIP